MDRNVITGDRSEIIEQGDKGLFTRFGFVISERNLVVPFYRPRNIDTEIDRFSHRDRLSKTRTDDFLSLRRIVHDTCGQVGQLLSRLPTEFF